MPEEGVLRPQEAGDRPDPSETMRVEGNRHPRGRGLPRPRAHADFDPAQILGFRDNGMPQGQIVPDDLPEVGGDAKLKCRNREFWCRGYYVDTVGKNAKKIEEYIRNQLKEDQASVQLSIDFDGDPFKG